MFSSSDGGTSASSVMEGAGDMGGGALAIWKGGVIEEAGRAGDLHGTCGRVPEFVATDTFWVAYEFHKGCTVSEFLGTTSFGVMYPCIAVEGA